MLAVDREFDYVVPDEVADRVRVGAIVRVPLHGRRVRGWVLALGVEPEVGTRLLALQAVVSDGPPAEVVGLCRWGARRWAGPRAAFLRAASPPNIVGPGRAPELGAAVFPATAAPLALPDARCRIVRWPPSTPRRELVASLVDPEGSTIVVVPDPGEQDELGSALRAEGRHVHVMRSGLGAAARTEAWHQSRRGACVVVGGRLAVLAPVPDLRAVVVLDDADESLKEERAPTWHARDLAVERSRRTGARLDVVSPAPSVEAQVLAPTTPPGRSAERAGWPRVEVVDLRDEPPGTGLCSSALGPALARALGERTGRAVCVLNRRGRARLLVCRSCGELVRCATCGAAMREFGDALECPRCTATRDRVCERCGSGALRVLRPGVQRVREQVAGLVPRARVLAVEAGSAPLPSFDVAVGTEAVLHRVSRRPGERPVRLVAFLDLDQELLAPRYRAVEQALWLLVRAARLVGDRAGGGSVLVQTRLPDDAVVRAVVHGDLGPVSDTERARRAELGFPPFGGLAELSGDDAAVRAACAALRGVGDVLGPSGGRALARAETADALADAFAAIDLVPARALGRLRVDVDPLRV